MAFSLIVMLAYQSAYGYVYERVGILSACFMAGSALGAARGQTRPLRLLMFCEGMGASVLLLATLLFRAEWLYALLMALGGAVFVTAVEHTRSADAASRSGSLYGLVLVPLFGTRNTILGMVLFTMMSLTVLLWKGHGAATSVPLVP